MYVGVELGRGTACTLHVLLAPVLGKDGLVAMGGRLGVHQGLIDGQCSVCAVAAHGGGMPTCQGIRRISCVAGVVQYHFVLNLTYIVSCCAILTPRILL
jgi:hypothetical protein